MMTKTKANAAWNKLTAEQRATLEHWMFDGETSYAQALKRARMLLASEANGIRRTAEAERHCLSRERQALSRERFEFGAAEAVLKQLDNREEWNAEYLARARARVPVNCGVQNGPHRFSDDHRRKRKDIQPRMGPDGHGWEKH